MSQAFSKDSIVRGALLMTGATYFTYAVGLVVSALVARTLGPVGFGTYAYTVWLSGVLVMMSNNGLTTTGIRFIPQSLGRGSESSAHNVHGWLLRWQHLATVLVAFGFLAGLAWLKPAAWGDTHLGMFVAVVLIATFGKTYYIFAISMAKGYSRFDIEAVSTVAMAILNLAAVAVLVVLQAPLVTYLWLFAALGIAHIGIASLQLRRARIVPGHAPLDPSLLASIRPHLRWTIVLTFVYAMSNKSIETFLLNRKVGPEEVGYFVIAASLTRGGIDLLTSGLTTVLMPAMAHGFGLGGQDRVNAILKTSLRYFIFLGLMLAGTGALFARLAIEVMYGSEFAPVINVFRAMVAVGAVTIAGGAYGAVLSTTDNQRLRAAFAIGSILVNVIAALLLVPVYGLWGAVIAHAITVVSTFLLIAVTTSRLLSAHPHPATIAKLMASAAISAAPAAILAWAWPGAWGNAVAGIAYAGLLVVSSVLLRVWHRSDLEILNSLFKRLPRFLAPTASRLETWLLRHIAPA